MTIAARRLIWAAVQRLATGMAGVFERLAAMFGAPEGPPAPARAPEPTPQSRRGPAFTADDPRIPDTTRPRVARLLAMAADIEARSERDPLLAAAVTEVRQMRDQHLPQLIASYAEIPPAHRAEIFRTTGRSASYKLNEALDRMAAKIEKLSRDLAQEDINSFADNLRFIEGRYGPGDPSI